MAPAIRIETLEARNSEHRTTLGQFAYLGQRHRGALAPRSRCDRRCERSSWVNTPDIVKLLLQHGACIEHRGENSYTPVDRGGPRRSYTRVLEVLLDSGAEINAVKCVGFTRQSAKQNREGSTSTVYGFCLIGPCTRTTDPPPKNPLFHAAARTYYGQASIVRPPFSPRPRGRRQSDMLGWDDPPLARLRGGISPDEGPDAS